MRGPWKVAIFQTQVIVQERHNETRKKKGRKPNKMMSNKEDSCEGEHFNTRNMKDYVVEFSIPKSDTFETVVLSVSGSRLIVVNSKEAFPPGFWKLFPLLNNNWVN